MIAVAVQIHIRAKTVILLIPILFHPIHERVHNIVRKKISLNVLVASLRRIVNGQSRGHCGREIVVNDFERQFTRS
jgi:hypothetical protein